MSDPTRLNIRITHSDASTTRWGPEEQRVENLPSGLSFTTSVPGGHKDCTLTLPRNIDASRYYDEGLGDTVEVLGPGNELVWGGRVTQLPRAHEDSRVLTVGCVGWSSHLTDNQSFRECYIDRDVSRWTDASAYRRAALGASYVLLPLNQTFDATDGAGFTLMYGTDNSLLPKVAGEAWYDAGAGCRISRVIFPKMALIGLPSSEAALSVTVNSSPADTAAGAVASSEQKANTSIDVTFATPTRYAYAQLVYTYALGGGSANTNYGARFHRPVVLGNHGLTLRGSAPDYGLYASDVIANAVSRACSKFTSVDIDSTSFPIPQLSFTDATTADEVISRCNAYHLYDYGCWGQQFFYKQPAQNTVWEARLADGAKLALEGDDFATVFNGVVVTYQDAYGRSRIAGPTSMTTADVTSAYLEDTDPDNPANAAGIPRKWANLSLSTVTTDAGAVQIGAKWLEDNSQPQRRGSITLTGQVRHPTQGMRPVWSVRAGDYIRLSDRPGDAPRKITQTSYDHESRTIRLDVGGLPNRIEAILERLGVNMLSAGSA